MACLHCGKPKGDEEYVMPEDVKAAPEVTDPKLLKDATAGSNWKCAFCGYHERNNLNECKKCGAGSDLSKRKQRREKTEQTANVDSLPPTSHEHGEPTSQTTNLPLIPAILVLCGLTVLIFLGYLLWPKPIRATVIGKHWSRSIAIEHKVIQHESGFAENQPFDAFNIAGAGLHFHHNDHRRVGSHQESYTIPVSCGETCRNVPRVCFPIPRTCTRNCRSNKNGYATCSDVCVGGGQSCTGGGQECIPKICMETRYRTIDDYQDFPIMMPYYNWDVWRWVYARTEKLEGDNEKPIWPVVVLQGDERESTKNQTYATIFRDSEGKERKFESADEGKLILYPLGSLWLIKVNGLGVQSVEPIH